MNPWESLEAFKLHQQNEATRKLKQINDTLARQSSGSSTGVDSAALQEQKRLLSKQAAAFTEQAEAQDRQTQLIRKQLEQLQQQYLNRQLQITRIQQTVFKMQVIFLM